MRGPSRVRRQHGRSGESTSNGMTQHRDGGSRAGGRTANEMTGRLPPSHAPRTCSTPRQEFLASRGGRKGRRLSRVQTAKAASFSWAGRKNEDTRRGLGATTRQAEAWFRCLSNSKFLRSPLHRIFRHMYGILNIDKK
jgi:hypothetical protein